MPSQLSKFLGEADVQAPVAGKPTSITLIFPNPEEAGYYAKAAQSLMKAGDSFSKVDLSIIRAAMQKAQMQLSPEAQDAVNAYDQNLKPAGAVGPVKPRNSADDFLKSAPPTP